MALRTHHDNEMTWSWRLMMLIGLLGIAAGVIVLMKPGGSLVTLAVISGIFLLVDGVIEVVASLSHQVTNRGFVALLGVASFLLGIMLVRHPIGGIVAVALLIGFWLIALGVVRFIGAFEAEEHRGWSFLVAAIELIAGIAIVSSPHIGFATLALLTGIAFIANGVGLFAFGWQMQELGHEQAPPGRHLGSAA